MSITCVAALQVFLWSLFYCVIPIDRFSGKGLGEKQKAKVLAIITADERVR